MELREDWLALVKEEILDPERKIVDPHHHFFDRVEGFPSYSLADLKRDASGHNVEQTVYVQCTEHYREDGPELLRPVGETEWVASIDRQAKAEGGLRIGGIVSDAHLRHGRAIGELLDAHIAASDLFRGIRDIACWAEGEGVDRPEVVGGPEMYADPKFREGFSELGPRGLSFDAYHYHTQTLLLADLARAFPGTTIVCDHLSTPLGIGPYAGRRDEIFEVWARDMSELATCPNVQVKLGGMAMPWSGFGWESAAQPPSSDAFVAAQARYYHHAIEAFGPDRCMFESNFPVDKLSLSYDVLWNAFKKIAARYSDDEQDQLFRGTAMRVYRLKPVG